MKKDYPSDTLLNAHAWAAGFGLVLSVLGFMLYAHSASAAVIFDSTNTSVKPATSYYWRVNDVTGFGCTFGLEHNLGLSFQYTTTSSTEISQINVSTTSSGTETLCLSWKNGVGEGGSACGSSGAGHATTTINFPDGSHPYSFPYGSPITFSSVSSTVGINEAISVNPVMETGLGVVGNMHLFCDGHDEGALASSTYGIPALQIVGFSSPVDFPIVGDYGLTGTTTTMTEDLGFFGNWFRDAMIWLFKPPDAVKIAYDYQVANLRTKVPWGWWEQVSAGFGSVSSTDTATTSVLSINVPHNGVTTTVAIFDIAASTALIPSNVLDLIRKIGGVTVWALFGAWIWTLVTNKKEDEIV